jgi:RNase P/RNase MRP subunit p30
VAFDWTDCAPLKAARKVVGVAIDRGVAFEAQYGALLHSSGPRRNALALAHALHAVSRGRAPLLLSSGAAAPNHFRSPHDAANL